MSCTVIDWDLVENTFIAKNTEKQECTGQEGVRMPTCTGHGRCLPGGVSAQGVSARGGMSSEYVNTHPLARGDLKLLADQLILKSLARIGDLNFFFPNYDSSNDDPDDVF